MVKSNLNEGHPSKSLHVSIKEYSDVISARIEYFEEIGNWRNIIFLPFNMIWRVLVMITTVFNCILVAYILIYEQTAVTITFTTYYGFEGIYFVNTMLVLLHRVMKYRKTKSYIPKNAYLLTLDIISLIPYYELYYLLMRTSYGESYPFATDKARAKVFLRLIAVMAFFINANNEPGLNHLLAMTVFHIVCYSLYCVFFSGFWYTLGKDIYRNGWKRYLTFHYINRESTFDMWVVCFTFVSSLFFHAWSGVIVCLTVKEYILVTIAMITSFFLHIIFYSNLTSLYIKHISDQYYFSYRLYVIKSILDKWKVPFSIKKSIIHAYNTFWEKRSGRAEMSKPFYTYIPTSLQKEVSLDTFWHFFHHSHFFNDTDVVFSRNLCPSMKCKAYTAGEFLYTKGELKSKIVYIVSGVIQLLSMDDQSSPVISFSSGTVLGEICCLMCVQSSSYLRCATYCEVQVLELKTLAYTMVKYPYISKLLWQKLNARLEIAHQLQHTELIKMKTKEEKRTSIRWFKSQWRLIADLAKQAKRTYDGTEIPMVPYHFSKFLNLYVLSDEVELKVRAICLKSEFPCVLDPRNKFKMCCDYLILIVVFIQGVYLPYFIIFRRKMTMAQVGLFYTLDLFYFFALYLDTSTAIKTKDRIISNIGDIIIYKGKQITIMIDIFATIPLELIGGIITSSSRVTDLLHLNRVFKVYRLISLVHSAQLNVWLDYTKLRIIKYFLLYTLIVYYLACITYSIVCFWECSLTGWYLYNKILKVVLITYAEEETPTPFVSSLHFIISNLLATAWKEFYTYSIPDMIMEQVVSMVGYFLISFCFAELGSCAVMRLKHQFDFREHINSLKFFARRNNLPEHLTDVMYRATHTHWMYSNGYEVTGEESVLKHIPASLKTSILTNKIINCLRTVPLFKHCNEKTLIEFAEVATIQICPPNMIVCRMDCKPTFLYTVLNGYCKLESSIPTDRFHEVSTSISKGSCFPCLEALLGIDTFIQVTSVTYLEIIKISRKDVLRIFEHYSEMYDDLMDVLNKHVNDNHTVLSRQKGRLPDMISTQQSQGRGEFFEYKCLEGFVLDEKEKLEYYKAFKVIGRWKFLRHIFLRKTINPTSTSYLRWEAFRCIISIIYVAFTLSLLKIFILHKIIAYTEMIFIIFGLIDVYIRMHVCYYNDIGIFVTHPLYTAGHYISTSFFIDVIGIFPINTLKFNAMFGASREVNTLIVMTVITRPLLLYKVFRGISYLQSQAKESKILFYENCKYLIIVLLFIGIAASALETFTCYGSDIKGELLCPNESWIVNAYYTDKYTMYTPTIVSYYIAFALYSSASLGTYRFLTDRYMWMICIFTVILFALKWFVLAKITSIWIGANKSLVQYQHNMNIFLRFCKYHRISSNLVAETVAHYEHQWEYHKGCDISNILKTLHPVLKGDFYQFMFEQYWRLTDVFHDATQGLIRQVSVYCQELHFKKDTVIIHCNDISDIFYIVCKGQVSVSIADYSMCLLNPGGIFGCLLPHGATRQTITATAKVHTTLLAIKSDKLTNLLGLDPKYLGRMRKFAILGNEFIPPRSDRYKLTLQARVECVGNLLTESIILTKKKKRRFLIHLDATWYHLYKHFVDVHLAVWSSAAVSVVIIKIGLFDMDQYFYRFLYIIDIIYWSKVIIHFHLTYFDRETGILVINHSYIAKRYLKSWSGFWLDVFTSFPFEIVFLYFKNEDWYPILFTNRTCRFIFMFLYYGAWKKRLTITQIQRCVYLMYVLLLIVHFTTCYWWLSSCPIEGCIQNKGNNQEGYDQVHVKSPFYSYLLSFHHVVNIFTCTGFNDMSANKSRDLITMIVIICVGQFTTIFLTIGFANILVLQKFVMSEYERMAKHILQYMKMINVSPSLRNKVWNYFAELWIRSYGSWLPQLIQDSPDHLKRKLMGELYGHYLSIHCLFKDTHVDFQRQLVACLEPFEFMPGMYIVEKGDIDSYMYFILKGEVIVYDKHGNNEIEQTNLGPHDSFGELQGVYGIPYDRSYKARFHCQILRLGRYKWINLLKWFPASKEKIEEAINIYHKRSDPLESF